MTNKMTTQSAESTQIAVLNVLIQSMKDTQSAMALDIKEIRNNKYVTQNDMQLAITSVTKDLTEKIGFLTDRVAFQTKVGMVVGGGMLIITIILGTVAKGIKW